jgi:hypothetical protein
VLFFVAVVQVLTSKSGVVGIQDDQKMTIGGTPSLRSNTSSFSIYRSIVRINVGIVFPLELHVGPMGHTLS